MLVSAESLFDKLNAAGGTGAKPNAWEDGYDKGIDEAIRILSKEPSIDPESVRKKAVWLRFEGRDAVFFRCSNCNAYYENPTRTPIENHFYYCPQCGAKIQNIDEHRGD